jgi:hypothetical protein
MAGSGDRVSEQAEARCLSDRWGACASRGELPGAYGMARSEPRRTTSVGACTSAELRPNIGPVEMSSSIRAAVSALASAL